MAPELSTMASKCVASGPHKPTCPFLVRSCSDYNNYMENWNKVFRFSARMVPAPGFQLVGPHDAERRWVGGLWGAGWGVQGKMKLFVGDEMLPGSHQKPEFYCACSDCCLPYLVTPSGSSCPSICWTRPCRSMSRGVRTAACGVAPSWSAPRSRSMARYVGLTHGRHADAQSLKLG